MTREHRIAIVALAAGVHPAGRNVDRAAAAHVRGPSLARRGGLPCEGGLVPRVL